MCRCGVRNALALALAAAGASSCDRSAAGLDACLPQLDVATVRALDGNVLAALVTTRIRFADSAIVRYRIADQPTGTDSASLSLSVVDRDSVELPVLGLLPSRAYVMRVELQNHCGRVSSSELRYTTEALPSDLPAFTAGGSDPQSGYVVLAAGLYGMAIDNSGRVVWYHKFDGGPGLNFQVQPNGRYVARPTSTAWVEIDALGRSTRTLTCANGMQPRQHDMIAAADGSYWLLCDDVRTIDLSAAGGSSTARVTGTAVQHLADDGTPLFVWSPFEHMELDLSQLEAVDRGGSSINWTHGNALDITTDGAVLLSFRNLSEIVKIDPGTGAVAWRLGGTHSDFQVADASSPPFARQHGLRSTGPGELLVLDNLGDSTGSHAKRFTYDETAKVMRLVASYGPGGGFVGQLGGSTQKLPRGHTLVSFGNGGRVEEYDSTGAVVWRIDGNAGYVFRAQRIRSLYDPGLPFK